MPTPQIFISHSHVDDDFGKKLALDLRVRLGEEAVWYDSSGSLHASEEWWNKIVAEITARDIFVVILSPSALESSWVRDEIAIAWLQKNRLGKRILPVIYLPNVGRGDLDTLHYVSFVEPRPYEDAFAQLLADLSIDNAQTPRTPTGPLTNNDSRSQTLSRLTSEIHTAFGREDWTQVLSKTAFLAGDIPEGMTAQLWNERGLAAQEVHDGSVAVAAFDASLKLDPYDIPTLRNRAHALILVNQLAEAAHDLERAYNLVPLDDAALRIEVIAELVAALRAAQQWDAALQRTDEALRLAQGDARWPRSKLDILEESGQEPEALRYAQTLMVTQRELALAWLEERFQRAAARSNWPSALALVDATLAVAPQDATWLAHKLDALTAANREAEAYALAAQLAQHESNVARRWVVERYEAHKRAANAGAMLADIDLALVIAPNNVDWQERKLDALALANRWDDAFALATELAPWQSESVLRWLNSSYNTLTDAHNWALANKFVALALQLAPIISPGKNVRWMSSCSCTARMKPGRSARASFQRRAPPSMSGFSAPGWPLQ